MLIGLLDLDSALQALLWKPVTRAKKRQIFQTLHPFVRGSSNVKYWLNNVLAPDYCI